MLTQHHADGGGTGPQGDEDGGKAERKGERRQHHRPARIRRGGNRGPSPSKLVHGDPGHVTQIGRHQGKDAGERKDRAPANSALRKEISAIDTGRPAPLALPLP